MPEVELPSTVIGLLAFTMAGGAYMVWNIQKSFLTYIETKNHNLEKATQAFMAKIEDFTVEIHEQSERHKDAMINQNDRHKQMMDDFAARLESFAKK